MTGQPAYRVDLRRMEEFSAVELYALLKLRVDVFIVEGGRRLSDAWAADGMSAYAGATISGFPADVTFPATSLAFVSRAAATQRASSAMNLLPSPMRRVMARSISYASC